MIKIMFVCHGNICRSPMAEFIFKTMLSERGLEDLFQVQSCATSSEEIFNGRGNPVYPPAKKELAAHGISCEGKRACQLKKSDYNEFDYFVCMDDNNVCNSLRIFGDDPRRKISKMMDYTCRPGNVSDPWYSGDFKRAFDDIYEGCEGLLEKVYRQKSTK